ncbi:hypothetical protein HC762_00960 [bacterium]|nr:hypothetical protein [bacterium]
MSAILSADDLNDFISPGVACIKPVEPLPRQDESSNPYEVTTEEKLHTENPPPASISLTDCLACSGCVTSAEAVLVSLQSHKEVLTTLDTHPSLNVQKLLAGQPDGKAASPEGSKLYVASVSPQVRASLAASYQISEREAGYLIDQLLGGPQGLRGREHNGAAFSYIVDTNRLREVSLVLGADEVSNSRSAANTVAQPILTSACPGWICYAEKSHPHVLPHLSRLKSPQALTGTLLKSVLSKAFKIHPSDIWHLAIMPCFDKKLEASREELTDKWWAHPHGTNESTASPVRDVDCVITSRELLSLANDRNINLQSLPLTPLSKEYRNPFPCQTISRFLFGRPRSRICHPQHAQSSAAGTSGGYLHHILTTQQSLHPNSTIQTRRGRNADVIEYTLVSASQEPLLKCARFYGFRNIQNLVRKLKPAKPSRLPGAAAPANVRRRPNEGVGSNINEYNYVEVMACPGGCTNGGGQIRADEATTIQTTTKKQQQPSPPTNADDHYEQNQHQQHHPPSQRDWLRRVDSAYFSITSSSSSTSSSPFSSDIESESDPDPDPDSNTHTTTITDTSIQALLSTWSTYTSIPLEKLVYTSFRRVESDVGKDHARNKSEDLDSVGGGRGGDLERGRRGDMERGR